MSDSVRPHRRQPTRLPRPWDSPGKNTGVGCHFLLQCRKVKSKSEVAQSCPTLRDPMDCSLPGSSVHGISQARALEWGASPSPHSGSSSNERMWHVLCSQASLVGKTDKAKQDVLMVGVAQSHKDGPPKPVWSESRLPRRSDI